MGEDRRRTRRAPHGRRETANDRLKRRFRAWFWAGISAATVLHFLAFVFYPRISFSVPDRDPRALEIVPLPPEVRIPPPPERIQRPAVPVVAATELEELVTIAPTTFEENPLDRLPPPVSQAVRASDGPVFTPYTVAPELLDPDAAARTVESLYPSQLKQLGVGGTVVVWAYIDDRGRVKRTEINTSSGHEPLDEAAETAVHRFVFRPALNRDQKVAVWVSIPITFAVERI